MSASGSGAVTNSADQKRPARKPSRLAKRLDTFMSTVGRLASAAGFPVFAIALFLIGFVLIALYAYSMSGPHLRYLSVGLLTACAALLVGSLAGVVVGVPRDVSSGAVRIKTSQATSQASTRPDGPGEAEDTAAKSAGGVPPPANAPAAGTDVGAFEPSTNLAEISDWLIKLLLGAGLVGLTHLGRPLTRLIDTVARGLAPAGKMTEAAVVMSAAILITYVVLGFLGGYLTTTLWYGKRLKAMFDR
jgi:hypothetical protein